MQRMNLTPLPMPKWSVLVQEPLNDKNLPDLIRQLVEQGFVISVTYYRMEYAMKASYTVAYRKEDKGSYETANEFSIVQ